MGNGSNDNFIFYGSNGSSSNCYISFENSSTAINACLVGLVGGNLQMRTPGTYQFDNSAGSSLMTLDSGGNFLLAGGLKVSLWCFCYCSFWYIRDIYKYRRTK